MAEYIISSGEVSSGINLHGNSYYDTMTVLDGGVTNTIRVGGSYYQHPSYVPTSGFLHVSSGGIANNTIAVTGGYLYVYSNGIANSTMVSGGYFFVSGGTANSTTVRVHAMVYKTLYEWVGSIYVFSGGTTNDTMVSGGVMSVFSGGTANRTLVHTIVEAIGGLNGSGGKIGYAASMYVGYGGTANSTTVSSGHMYVSSGGVANSTTLIGGELIVGGIANSTTVNAKKTILSDSSIFWEAGRIIVSSGGTAIDTSVNSGCYLEVSSGCMVSRTSIFLASTTIAAEGIANSTTLLGGKLFVCGTMSNTSVSGGVMYVSDGGKAIENTVTNDGSVYISSGGTASNTIVNPGCVMYVSDGGVAIGIRENGGFVDVTDNAEATFVGNAFSDLILQNSATVHSGTTTNRTTIKRGGKLLVFSGGTANSTVQMGGSLFVSSGGTVNDTIVGVDTIVNNFGLVERTIFGSLYISSGGEANDTTVSGGNLYVLSGGTANRTTISSGYFYISSGGTASNTIVNPGCYLEVSSGATAVEIKENGGRVVCDSGANVTFVSNTLNDLLLESGAAADIHSGTTANRTEIKTYGTLFVCSGGIANSTKVYQNAYLRVGAKGVANSTMVNSGAAFTVSGGTANSATVSSGGRLYVGCDGTAKDTTVQWGGSLFVSSGGVAERTTVEMGGSLFVSSGGTVNDTVVSTGGTLFISSGGRLSLAGQTILAGKNVSAYKGAVIAFNIANLAPDTAACIDYLSQISGYTDADFTLTIAGFQKSGTYTLARVIIEGSSWGEFNKTISVVNASGTQIGKLSVGSVSTINGAEYTLNISGRSLTVTINSTMVVDTIVPTVSNITASTTAPTNQNVTVTANFDDDMAVASQLYKIGAGIWTDYVDGVTMTENGMVYFKVIDAAGNETEDKYEVTNIDKVAPTITGITPSTTEPATSVTVTANFADDVELASKQYKVGLGDWNDYTTGVTVTANTTVYFKAVDTAGNEASAQYEVTNIEITIPDTTKPTVTNIKADMTEPTNRSVTVTASFKDDIAVASSRYRIGAGAWQNYTTGVTISENSTIYFKAIDTSGNESEVVSYEVTNIDKVKPEKPTASADITDATDTEVKVSAVFSDDSIVREYSHDNETWTAYTEAVVFTENGVVYFRGMDAAGNISEVASYTVSNITGGTSVTSSGVVLYSRQKAVVQANEIYEDTTVSSGGSMLINPEGVANGITLDYGGYLSISSGGIVKGINANSGCKVYVSAGGTATEITENGGYVEVTNGATVSFLPNSFSDVSVLIYISIHSGTIANNTNLTGSMFVYSGGVANNTSNGGTMSVSSGAVVNNTICKNRGQLNLYGGTANNTTVNTNGMFNINPGGAADGITVSSGGWLSVYNGKITGKMTFEEGAHISAMEKTILDFDISELESGSGALVNNLSLVQGAPNYTLTVSDTQAVGTYKLAEGAGSFDTTISVVNTAGESFGTFAVGGTVKVGDADCTLKLIDSVLSVTVSGNTAPIDNLVGTPDKVSWEVTAPGEEQQFIVEYSTDNFAHVIRLVVDSNSLDSFQMPAGNYQWRVKPEGGEDWIVGDPVTATAADNDPKLVKSNKDGIADVFFANVVETWEAGYVAQHVGSINDWTGTNEYATVFGKNKLADIIEGSTDANILLLTDEDNGDTLFVDDIYTDLPGSVAEQQSRIAQIDEIRAGAGDDIVDMTSQRFEYIGDGLTIRGGEGNDTIWANKGDNFLFGDAGNDRIVGASGNDVIAGGIGNDRMHGGGGDDVFTFCDNWGADNVEQLAGGSVTLWFASGSEANWNASTLTYTDGNNTVKVFGVTLENITLKFGDNKSDQFAALTSADAFAEFTSQKIFEESGKGILASL